MGFADQVRADIAAGYTDVVVGVLKLTGGLDAVISYLENEIENVKPRKFRDDAEVRTTSFGAADNSSLLALDYTRAHAVTHAALKEAKHDLAQFRDACRDVKRVMKDADQDAALRSTARRRAIDSLLNGSEAFFRKDTEPGDIEEEQV